MPFGGATGPPRATEHPLGQVISRFKLTSPRIAGAGLAIMMVVFPPFSQTSQVGDPMSEISEPEPLAATGPPHLDLFMTVIRVVNWQTTVRWYIDTLGLSPILLDSPHEFALLSAGNGRLGLQGVKGCDPWRGPVRSGSSSRCRTWTASVSG